MKNKNIMRVMKGLCLLAALLLMGNIAGCGQQESGQTQDAGSLVSPTGTELTPTPDDTGKPDDNQSGQASEQTGLPEETPTPTEKPEPTKVPDPAERVKKENWLRGLLGMSELKNYLKLVDGSLFYRMDYPDIDVIRVDDTYYCITTTMHFFPGAEILTSKDLVHWKHETYVYETLDSTDKQTLKNGDVYGKGMWAATLRYHNGMFYVAFVANDTGKTYLYRAEDIHGPWTKTNIEGFFHDCSLLFDDDGRTYIIYGNRTVWITELNEDLSAPKAGGVHRILIEDKGNPSLGYEGAKAFKIDGTYYFMFIHSKPDRWRRTEACFYTDSLDGELIGGDMMDYDLGYRGAGIAQGNIIDTPDGRWFAILFQDRGASGRTPVLFPVHFDGKMPILDNPMELSSDALGNPLSIPEETEEKPAPVIASYEDDFESDTLDAEWQWNHEPDLSLVKFGKENGGLTLTTGKLTENLLHSTNSLTRRLVFPGCKVTVTVDGSDMKDGDVAGLGALLGSYGSIALTKDNGMYEVYMTDYVAASGDKEAVARNFKSQKVNGEAVVELSMEVTFGGNVEQVLFFVNGNQVGLAKEISFALDHFCGCRAALFNYATKETGGTAKFTNFKLEWER